MVIKGSAEAKAAYQEKLKDPRWQMKRGAILEQRGRKCEECGAENVELHVHHLRYKGEPWEVPDEWLRVLCKEHHDKAHGIVSEPDPELVTALLVEVKPSFGMRFEVYCDRIVTADSGNLSLEYLAFSRGDTDIWLSIMELTAGTEVRVSVGEFFR